MHTKKEAKRVTKRGRARKGAEKTAKKKRGAHAEPTKKVKGVKPAKNAVTRDQIEAQVLEWREKAREGYVPVWTRTGAEFFRNGTEVSHGIFGDYIPLKKQTFEDLKSKYGSKNWNGLK